MSKEWRNQALQHFKSVCEKEFSFLVDDFGFTPTFLPPGEFVNDFQFRLSNSKITIVIEGINYGNNAMVSIEDNYGRSVVPNQLMPGWKPFAKLKRQRKKDRLNQDQQIAQAAKQLMDYGQDVLNGDLERFQKIGDRLNNIEKRFKEYRLKG
ncbi:hypothetical protein ACFLW2_01860 [Chloroflexota bacterium]